MAPRGPQAREAGDPRGAAYVSAPSLRQALIALVEDIPGLLSDRVRLLLLELRRTQGYDTSVLLRIVHGQPGAETS